MKKRWISVILACALGASLALGGCGNTEKSKNDKTKEKQEAADNNLVIPILADIDSFYTVGTGDITGDVLGACYDQLFTVKDQDVTDYYVAKSCEMSEDGKEYTVSLNEGIKWHDGEELTADDLIFTLTSADPYGYFTYFAGGPIEAEKIDEYTVKVKLQKPSNGFVQRLGTVRVMPAHCYEGLTAEEIAAGTANTEGIGMGPYKLVEWKKGESITFEKNKEYYRGEPPFEKIIYKVMPDSSAQQIAFDKGEIDVLRILNQTNLEKYESDESCNILELSENRVSFLVFNASSKNITTLDEKKAIISAIVQQAIVDQAYGSEKLAKPAKGMYIDSTKYMDTSLANYEQDTELAQKLAKDTGLTEKTINLYYSTDRASMEDVAMVVQQQLKAVGIECEIIGTDIYGWMIPWQEGTDTIDMVLNGWDNMQGEPGFEWAIYADGASNYYMPFSNETTDILQKATVSVSEDDKIENYQAFQKSCMEDYWADPLVDTGYILAIKSGMEVFEKEQPDTWFFEDYIKAVK